MADLNWDEDETLNVLTTLHGKTIAHAALGKTNGYDTLLLEFMDGTNLVVREQGQAGYFSVAIT